MIITCPRCQQQLECSPELSGQSVHCSRCYLLLAVPIFEPPEPEPIVRSSAIRQSKKDESADWTVFAIAVALSACIVGVVIYYSVQPSSSRVAPSTETALTENESNGMILLAVTYVKSNTTNPDSVYLPALPELTRKGSKVRVSGKMQAAHKSSAIRTHAYYVDLERRADDWYASRVVIDGEEVWRKP